MYDVYKAEMYRHVYMKATGMITHQVRLEDGGRQRVQAPLQRPPLLLLLLLLLLVVALVPEAVCAGDGQGGGAAVVEEAADVGEGEAAEPRAADPGEREAEKGVCVGWVVAVLRW